MNKLYLFYFGGVNGWCFNSEGPEIDWLFELGPAYCLFYINPGQHPNYKERTKTLRSTVNFLNNVLGENRFSVKEYSFVGEGSEYKEVYLNRAYFKDETGGGWYCCDNEKELNKMIEESASYGEYLEKVYYYKYIDTHYDDLKSLHGAL